MVEIGEIFSRCSPTRVYSTINGLSSEKKDVIKEMGFGSLLGMKKCNLRKDLIYWLIEKFDPVDGSLNFQSKKITLNSAFFAKTLGVLDGVEDVGDLNMEDACKRVNGDVRRKLSEVEETLKNHQEADELFLNNFVIFVCGTLLLPTTSLYVVRKLEESLKEIKSVKQVRMKNWASCSWRFLVEGIRRYKERTPQFVSGCVYFFQLYYLNELEGHDRYVDKSLCPTNWWSEKEMKHVFEWINGCGGFDKVKLKGNDTKANSRHTEEVLMPTSTVADRFISEFGVVKSQIESLRGEIEENIKQQLEKVCHEVISGVAGVFDNNTSGSVTSVHETNIGTKNISTENAEDYLRQVSTDVASPTLLLGTSKTRRHHLSLRTTFENFIDSAGKVVGPFILKTSVNFTFLSLAAHIFNEELSLSDVIFRHKQYKVVRLYFTGLLPNCKIDFQLIGAYVLMIRWHELTKYNVGRTYCFVSLPSRKKNGSLLDVDKLVQDEYDLPLCYSAKVILPILDIDDDHWIMTEFNLIDNACGIWDSLGVRLHSPRRWKMMAELATTLDSLNNATHANLATNPKLFSSMKYTTFDSIPVQENNTDCGVFLMKFIEAAVNMNEAGTSIVHPFDPSYERLQLGIQIILSVANDLSGDILSGARANMRSLSLAVNESRDIIVPTSRVDNPCRIPPHPLLSTKRRRQIFWQRGRRG